MAKTRIDIVFVVAQDNERKGARNTCDDVLSSEK